MGLLGLNQGVSGAELLLGVLGDNLLLALPASKGVFLGSQPAPRAQSQQHCISRSLHLFL